MLVVGSGRPGDDTDVDPPCNGVILLGWHDEGHEAQAEASREGYVIARRRNTGDGLWMLRRIVDLAQHTVGKTKVILHFVDTE